MKSKPIRLDLVWADASRSPIQLQGASLGSGADAGVYRIAGYPELVAKVYHDPAKDPDRCDKIRAMMVAPPDLPAISENGTTYYQTAWPKGILKDSQGKFIGYAMPFVDLKQSTVLENLLAKKSRQLLNLPDFYGFRVSAAANLAALVAALHQCGHHIIDLKPVNINVYTDTFYTALLDCDGLSIQGGNGRRFAAHQYTEGYIAPEAMREKLKPQMLGVYQDRFALAVVIFQLINKGIHPYQGIPSPGFNVPTTTGQRIRDNLYAYGTRANAKLKPSPWSIHTFLEDETRRLFDRAFGLQHLSRPSADEWKDHLRQLLEGGNGSLQRCGRNANHAHFSKGCGFCSLEKSKAKPQPRPSVNKRAKKRNRSPRPATQTIHRPVMVQSPAASARRGCFKISLYIIVIMAALCGGIAVYYAFNNVHRDIERNNVERFDRRVRNNKVSWIKITRDDAFMAMKSTDDRILEQIIQNIQPLPQDYEFITRLVDFNHSRALAAYQQRMRDMAQQEQNKNSGSGIEAIFLSGNVGHIEPVLGCQADPDLDIRLYAGTYSPSPQDLEAWQVLSSIAERSGILANYHWCDDSGSPELRSVMGKFGKKFRIPAFRTDSILLQIAAFLKWRNRGKRNTYYAFGRGFQYRVNPVHIAALKNNEAYLRLLIDSGADLSKTLFDGRGAAQLTHSRRIYTMLRTGRKKLSPFYKAIAEDNAVQFKNLMEKATPVRTKTDDPDSFEFAVDHGSLRIVDMFYRLYGKTFDKGDVRLLVKAYRSQNPMLLAYFLEKGGSVNKRFKLEELREIFGDEESLYALTMAFKSRKLKQYYDKQQEMFRFGDYLKNKALKDGRWDVVQILDAYQSGWQPLHYAVVRQDLDKIRSVLEADPKAYHARDKMGRTPLILAGYYDCEASVRRLMNYQQDPTQEDDSGYSVLHYAAYNGNLDLVQNLLSKGASKVNKDDPNCRSALDKIHTLNDGFVDAYHAYLEYNNLLLNRSEHIPFKAEKERRYQAQELVRKDWLHNPESSKCRQQ